MLREVKPAGETVNAGRRWFTDDYFELIFWLDDDQDVESFQLCYDRGRNERALTWNRTQGLRHLIVDQGENSPLKNRTPILHERGSVDRGDILGRFTRASALLPERIAEFVKDRIREVPAIEA